MDTHRRVQKKVPELLFLVISPGNMERMREISRKATNLMLLTNSSVDIQTGDRLALAASVTASMDVLCDKQSQQAAPSAVPQSYSFGTWSKSTPFSPLGFPPFVP